MQTINDYEIAWELIRKGKVLAYPTEAVYGLGCDPFNFKAVQHLLFLKNRAETKGFILLISKWEQLYELIAPLEERYLRPVRETWPGPVTWVFPRAEKMPEWISGAHPSIAIRMSAHPVAHKLCEQGPIISTSANISGMPPARHINELNTQFSGGIEAVVEGELGGASAPTSIYEVLTRKRLR